MRLAFTHWVVLGAFLTLSGCGEVQERLQGYPKQDTVLQLETATPNQIADALSQMKRIQAIGDDWELLDPADLCTVHVLSKSGKDPLALDLRNAEFSLHRDPHSHRYYATMKHGDQVMRDAQQQPLRLVEAENYHDVFFAEGYLLALTQKCQRNRQLQARARTPSKS